MVQTQRNEQAVGKAVEEQTDIARGNRPVAKRADDARNGRPDKISQSGNNQTDGARYNGYKTPSAEKRQVRRQLNAFVFVVQQAGGNAHNDTAQHAHVNAFVQYMQGGSQNNVSHIRGQSGSAVVFIGKADGDTQSENNRQVGKDRLPRFGYESNV